MKITSPPTLVLCMILAGLSAQALARPLAEVLERKSLSICANPDALPYAKRSGEVHGFQVDIGEALARQLGVGFEAKWIIPSRKAKLVDCDLKMDFIVQGLEADSKLKLSEPYAKGGVALALAKGQDDIVDFATVVPGRKIGVMLNSVASVTLQKRGWATSPYAFEDDMLEDLEKGDIAGAAISSNSIQYYIHTHPGTPLRFVHANDGEIDLEWTLAVGVRRGDAEMVAAINTALDQLIADGTMAAIYAKYGIEYRRP
ncbi:MAG: transporter substrate-binding domain-containing protein [Betaproteobacteria bacterium]